MALRQNPRSPLLSRVHLPRPLESVPHPAVHKRSASLAECIQPSRTRKIQHRLGAALGKGDRTPAGDSGKQGERIQSCSIRPEIPPAILQAIRRQRIADPRRTRAIQALPPAVSTIPAREKMALIYLTDWWVSCYCGCMKAPNTLQAAIQFFSDYENCRQFMIEVRWTDGKVR